MWCRAKTHDYVLTNLIDFQFRLSEHRIGLTETHYVSFSHLAPHACAMPRTNVQVQVNLMTCRQQEGFALIIKSGAAREGQKRVNTGRSKESRHRTEHERSTSAQRLKVLWTKLWDHLVWTNLDKFATSKSLPSWLFSSVHFYPFILLFEVWLK